MGFPADRTTTIPLNERPDLDDKEELIELIHMIDFAKRHRTLHEQLYQLHAKGPVWDGDVISKSERSDLLRIGACAKVCVKGEDGFNACTYFGRSLLRVYDWLYGTFQEQEMQHLQEITRQAEDLKAAFEEHDIPWPRPHAVRCVSLDSKYGCVR